LRRLLPLESPILFGDNGNSDWTSSAKDALLLAWLAR
jgi:hypothetical protein